MRMNAFFMHCRVSSTYPTMTRPLSVRWLTISRSAPSPLFAPIFLFEVNLVSFYEVCHYVVPVMKRADYGRVVNMASISGKEGTPFRSAYSAAKAGVIAFTKSLAKELAGTNVLVNAIAPAAIDTEILLQLYILLRRCGARGFRLRRSRI
jgi:NAD(P)-dependent dehydrogenase (short-subunit alcohol dehydrogenase family)